MKFLALSENKQELFPRLEKKKLFKAAINAVEVKSVTISKCRALVAKQTNIDTYTFWKIPFR